jgi:hypothetical protein
MTSSCRAKVWKLPQPGYWVIDQPFAYLTKSDLLNPLANLDDRTDLGPMVERSASLSAALLCSAGNMMGRRPMVEGGAYGLESMSNDALIEAGTHDDPSGFPQELTFSDLIDAYSFVHSGLPSVARRKNVTLRPQIGNSQR